MGGCPFKLVLGFFLTLSRPFILFFYILRILLSSDGRCSSAEVKQSKQHKWQSLAEEVPWKEEQCCRELRKHSWRDESSDNGVTGEQNRESRDGGIAVQLAEMQKLCFILHQEYSFLRQEVEQLRQSNKRPKAESVQSRTAETRCSVAVQTEKLSGENERCSHQNFMFRREVRRPSVPSRDSDKQTDRETHAERTLLQQTSGQSVGEISRQAEQFPGRETAKPSTVVESAQGFPCCRSENRETKFSCDGRKSEADGVVFGPHFPGFETVGRGDRLTDVTPSFNKGSKRRRLSSVSASGRPTERRESSPDMSWSCNEFTRSRSTVPDNDYFCSKGSRLELKVSRLSNRDDAVSRVNSRQPPTFNGKAEWAAFRVQFEMFAELSNWTQAEMGLQLAVCLRGPARATLALLEPEVRRDYESLVRALEARFEPEKHQRELFRAKLRNRTRRKGESLPALAHDVMRMVQRAYPVVTGRGKQELAVVSFADALCHDPDLQMAVWQEKPQALDDAVGAAVRFESFRAARRDRHGGDAEGDRAVQKARGLCFYCSKPRHRIDNCRKRARDLKMHAD